MLVCLHSVLTKASRPIYKIVAKIKEAMVAFVHHWMPKITKQPYTNKKIPLKNKRDLNDCLSCKKSLC